jgi:hypothetical protein
MAILSSTAIRTALVDYRAELIRMQIKYPQTYKENDAVIKSIDDALYEIEGNVQHVMISAHSCKA